PIPTAVGRHGARSGAQTGGVGGPGLHRPGRARPPDSDQPDGPGTKKDALRVAAELTVRPVTRAASATVAELLTQWVEQNEATWAASTRRDNPGRAAAILADPLAKMPISRVSVAAIERWHTRMRRAGVGETAIKNRHTVLRAA